MGNVLTNVKEERLVLITRNSNLIQPITRSYSNIDLKSGLTSRTMSFQGISTPLIEGSVSDIITRMSSRIPKTSGIIQYLSRVKSNGNEDIDSDFETSDCLDYDNYIFETLDFAEKRSRREYESLNITGYKNLDINNENNSFNHLKFGIRFELESRESLESFEDVSKKKDKLHIDKTKVDVNNSIDSIQVKNNFKIKSKTFKIFGNKRNHKPFLSPGIIDVFLPFILDETLLSCFLVCPHWLLTIANFINERYCNSIDEKFKKCYAQYLDLEYAAITSQPVLTVGGSIRIDRVLYAKVLRTCANKTSDLSYKFKYKNISKIKKDDKRTKSLSCQNFITPIIQPSSKKIIGLNSSSENPTFISSYKFETKASGTRRVLWAHKDVSRCHCEEVAVAQTTTTSALNVGDRVEVAINISNSFGVVDLDSIEFCPLILENIRPEKCEVEDMYQIDSDWRSYNGESESKEYLNIPNFMPQLEVISLDYAGADIITYRIRYRAVKQGDLVNSKEHLGINVSVVPKEYAIISALKRKGLQHDRYSPLQLRVEDQLILYISKGGAIPT